MFVKSTLSTTLDFTNFVTRDALFVRSANFPIENIQLDKTAILNVVSIIQSRPNGQLLHQQNAPHSPNQLFHFCSTVSLIINQTLKLKHDVTLNVLRAEKQTPSSAKSKRTHSIIRKRSHQSHFPTQCFMLAS